MPAMVGRYQCCTALLLLDARVGRTILRELHVEFKGEAEMNTAWNKLPTAFGFNSWAEVKKSGDFPTLTIRTY